MPSISDRIREQREARGFSQQALADLCGIAGRSQQNYESGARSPDSKYLAALATAGFDVRYILTGEAPPEETQDQLIDRHQRIKDTTAFMRALPLKETTKTRLATLINGDTKRDAALLVADLRNEFLDPRSRAVLDNYEHASESGKKIIEGTASMAAQPKPAPNVAVSGGIHQTSHAAGGVQVGLAMGQVNVKQKGKKKP